MATADLIIGRRGDSLLGTVLEEEFRIRTDFGELKLARKRVAWIHFTDPPRFPADEVWLHSGDRLSGKVLGSAIRFRPSGGKVMRIPRSAIHTIMLEGGVDPGAASLRGR